LIALKVEVYSLIDVGCVFYFCCCFGFASFLAAGFDSVVDFVFVCAFARLEASLERSEEEASSRAALNFGTDFAPPLASVHVNVLAELAFMRDVFV
jgi:hypothetical protein